MADRTRRALVVGLGVAGMSAAIALRDAGWTPVLVERAAGRRAGGYFVAVFPEGKEAAKKLGAYESLHVREARDATSWNVDRAGRAAPGTGFLDRPGEPHGVLRGDIENALWRALSGEDGDAAVPSIEIRYSTSPVRIVDGDSAVEVTLRNSEDEREYTERFDLVVGADGLRSTVRSLVFGPHTEFIQPWNAMVCAFELDSQVPGFAAKDSIVHALPGRALWVFGFKDRTPTALLTYRTREVSAQFARPPIEVLREAYTGMDHVSVSHALDALENAPGSLFDSANQVRMRSWHKGRVVLVGDSAWCLTLYSGMGASSAMRGGAELGAALRAHPDDLEAALRSWEKGLRPFITKHMRSARLLQQLFVPSNRFAAAMRSGLMKVLGALKRTPSEPAARPSEQAAPYARH